MRREPYSSSEVSLVDGDDLGDFVQVGCACGGSGVLMNEDVPIDHYCACPAGVALRARETSNDPFEKFYSLGSVVVWPSPPLLPDPFDTVPSPAWTGKCRACGQAIPGFCEFCDCLDKRELAVVAVLGNPDAEWPIEVVEIKRAED